MTAKLRYAFLGAAAVMLIAVSFTPQAEAGGFAIREQSTEGLGAAFAGIAAGGADLSSMFYNPATIVLHSGKNFEVDGNLIIPYSRAKDGATTPALGLNPDSGNLGSLAPVPSTYGSWQVDDKLFVGFAFNAPFGLVTESRDVWAGSVHGVVSDLKTFNLNPMMGIRLGKALSIGFGVQIQYAKATLTSRLPIPFAAGGFESRLKGDDVALGFTAGVLIEPVDGTRIGLGFRSGISHKLRGRGQFASIAGAFSGSATAPLDLPETLTLSLRQDVGEDFTLLASFECANWDVFKTLTATSVGVFPGGTTVTPENWNGSYFFSVGGEYKATDKLTVRAGVAYEDSPVPDSTRTPRVPDNNRFWVNVGGSYNLNNWISFSAAYSHIFMEDGDVNLPAGTLPGLTATFKQETDIVAVSARMMW